MPGGGGGGGHAPSFTRRRAHACCSGALAPRPVPPLPHSPSQWLRVKSSSSARILRLHTGSPWLQICHAPAAAAAAAATAAARGSVCPGCKQTLGKAAHAPDFGEGGRKGVGLVVKGEAAGEELVCHHPRRPHVAGGAHLTAQALRGHEPARGAGGGREQRSAMTPMCACASSRAARRTAGTQQQTASKLERGQAGRERMAASQGTRARCCRLRHCPAASPRRALLLNPSSPPPRPASPGRALQPQVCARQLVLLEKHGQAKVYGLEAGVEGVRGEQEVA